MSPAQTLTLWTCTRCRAALEVDHDNLHDGVDPAGFQPRDWSRVNLATPPRASGAAYRSVVLGDLCPDCVTAIYEFLGSPPTAEPATATGVAEAWAACLRPPPDRRSGRWVDATVCRVSHPLAEEEIHWRRGVGATNASARTRTHQHFYLEEDDAP